MKNLVVCYDGTGNEISQNISNVLKFYRTLKKTDAASQVVFYHTGVGTLARPNPWTKFSQDAKTVLGLATGYGLEDAVLAAYEFLIQNYEEDDKIYLLGFSRGAHTARVLAAFIHKIGLLRPQQRNLAGPAFTAYKQSAEVVDETVQHEDDRATQFARIVSTRWPTIKFLGVWDTVASVIVPGWNGPYLFSLQNLPYSQRNPSVEVFRQAASIDEKRRMFRLQPWKDGQQFHKNRFSETNNSKAQDAKQVWFAGVHSDVGGGYPETESGLSKFPLLWMIGEAQKHGLQFVTQTVNQLARGVQREGSPFTYVVPNAGAKTHESLKGAWHILEKIPKRVAYKEWPARRVILGRYLPNGEPRPIADGALIHHSVFDHAKADSGYKPVNLPANYKTEPSA